MKKTTLVVLISIAFTNFALVNANAGSLCNNGTLSSNSGRGTCSSNRGVNKKFPSYSDPVHPPITVIMGLAQVIMDLDQVLITDLVQVVITDIAIKLKLMVLVHTELVLRKGVRKNIN